MIHHHKILKLTIFLVSIYLIGPLFIIVFTLFLLQASTPLCNRRYFARTRRPNSATTGPKNERFATVEENRFGKKMFPGLLKGLTDISDKIFPLNIQYLLLFPSNVT